MMVQRQYARRLLAGAVLAAAIAVTGCGSSDESTSTSSATSATSAPETTTQQADPAVAQAKADVQKLEERPTSIGITEPIDGPVPSGKRIDYLACGVPACVELGKSLKQAAAAVGWKVNVINQGLTPEEVKGAWEQVVRDPPDAVVTTGGFPIEIFADELKQLHDAGGVMVSVADVAPPEPEKGYIAAVAGADRARLAGRQMADWVIAQTDGDANVQMINVSGFPSVEMQYQEFKSRLAEQCPDCKMTTYDAPLTSFGKDMASNIAQQLRKNPDANVLVLGSGDMAVGVPDALAAAGVSKDIPTITQGQTPAIVQVMKDGGLSSIYGQEPNEIMWRSIDVLIRHFAGQSLEPDAKGDVAVQWFITPENVPSTTDVFPLVEDYQDQYRQLWGVQ